MQSRLLLIAMPEMRATAERIVALYPDRIELGEIDMSLFADTFPNSFIEGAGDFADRDVAVLFNLDDKKFIFDQVSVMYTLAAQRPRSLRFLVPYFPTGTMEDVRKEGQVATAWTLAIMISACAPAGPGPIPVYMWDIHALPIRHYFGSSIAPRFKSGVKWLKMHLAEQREAGVNIAIGLPDMGSLKRYEPWFIDPVTKKPLYEMIVCDKVRKGDDRLITIRQGNPKGYRVYSIDDLVHGGGTAIESARAYLEHGADSVVNYCTHAVMENNAHLRFIECGLFHKVMITNTVPATVKRVAEYPLFEVISLDRSMGNALLEGLGR